MFVILFGADYTVDGLTYAVRVETGLHLFHANHMLPNYVWWVIQNALEAIGMTPRSAFTIQVFNVIFGLAGCTVLYGALRLYASPLNSGLLVSLIFFSFGWWAFSHEPEAYVPALALTRRRLRNRPAQGTTQRSTTLMQRLRAGGQSVHTAPRPTRVRPMQIPKDAGRANRPFDATKTPMR